MPGADSLRPLCLLRVVWLAAGAPLWQDPCPAKGNLQVVEVGERCCPTIVSGYSWLWSSGISKHCFTVVKLSDGSTLAFDGVIGRDGSPFIQLVCSGSQYGAANCAGGPEEVPGIFWRSPLRPVAASFYGYKLGGFNTGQVFPKTGNGIKQWADNYYAQFPEYHSYDFNCQRFSVGLFNSLANTHKKAYQWYSLWLKPLSPLLGESFDSRVTPVACQNAADCGFAGAKCAISNGASQGQCIPAEALRPGDQCGPPSPNSGYCYKGTCRNGVCKGRGRISSFFHTFTIYNVIIVLTFVAIGVAIYFCLQNNRLKNARVYGAIPALGGGFGMQQPAMASPRMVAPAPFPVY